MLTAAANNSAGEVPVVGKVNCLVGDNERKASAFAGGAGGGSFYGHHHHHHPPHHHHHHHHHHPQHHPVPPHPPQHHLHSHYQETPPKPRFLFRMPRVVPNQKEKYESDDLMKRHSREGEVRFTGFRDRPLLERQGKFIQSLREGHTEIAFIGTGFNLVLAFDTFTHSLHPPERRQLDFEKEPGKVYIRSPMILNGVCLLWKGYIDMERLDGVGSLEFDEEMAKIEDAILREQVEAYNRRMKEFEEHRKMQQRQLAAFMGQHQAAMAAAAASAATASVKSSDERIRSSPETTTTTADSSDNNNKTASSSTSEEKLPFSSSCSSSADDIRVVDPKARSDDVEEEEEEEDQDDIRDKMHLSENENEEEEEDE